MSPFLWRVWSTHNVSLVKVALGRTTYSEPPWEVLPDYHCELILLRRPVQRHEAILSSITFTGE
jgi:hypothetical protein